MAEALAAEIVVGGVATGVSYAAAAKAAIVVYGLYTSYSAAKAARRSADSRRSDRTVSVNATDMPYATVYGRREVGGRIAYIVQASDAQPKFYMVIALAVQHEIDAVEEVLFNGKAIGPIFEDIYSEAGGRVGPGSPYYVAVPKAATINAIAPADGVLVAAGMVTGVVTFHATATAQTNPISYNPVTVGDVPGGLRGDDGNPASNYSPSEIGIQNDLLIVPAQHRGKAVLITYTYLEAKSHVKVWAKRGTADQTAFSAISAVDAKWTSQHRLRGIPALAIEIDPDLELFPSGMPVVTAVIRGKRVNDPRIVGAPYWSTNPALQIRDYLQSAPYSCTDSEIDDSLLISAANSCEEVLQASLEPPGYVSVARLTTMSVSTSGTGAKTITLATSPGAAGGPIQWTWTPVSAANVVGTPSAATDGSGVGTLVLQPTGSPAGIVVTATLTTVVSSITLTAASTQSVTRTTLTDAYRKWATDEWAQGYVRIIEGTGVGGVRQILSNTGTTLTVSAPWDVTPAAGSVYQIEKHERRYESHCVLSTEADPQTNLQVMLAAMAGSATYAGATVAIRAGVAQSAVGSLDWDDLADGDYQIQPFKPTIESFNGVRGRYWKYDLTQKTFTYTDYPEYRSPTYLALDNDFESIEEIDLEAVQSPTQVQRISKLRLHQNRNSATFRANFKLAAAAFSAGDVINFTMPNLGQYAKPWIVLSRKRQGEKVDLLMQELPNATFAYDYRESSGVDPAPNTSLPSVGTVQAMSNFRAESGPTVADYGPNGITMAIVRVTWDMTKDFNVRYGGHVELWFKKSNQVQWTKERLPGDSTRFDIPVIRGDQLAIQARNSNGIANGQWSTISHAATDAPTPFLVGNLLRHSRPQRDPQKLSLIPPQVFIPGWRAYSYLGSTPALEVGDLQPASIQNAPAYGFIAKPIGEEVSGPAAAGEITTLESDPLPMAAQQRAVVFFRSWSVPDVWETYGWIRCYGASGAFLGDIAVTVPTGYVQFEDLGGGLRNVVYPLVAAFGTTPPGTATVSMCVARRQLVADDRTAYSEVYEPYLGIASAGQVALPPWSP